MDTTCFGVGFSQRQKGGELCCFYSCRAFSRPRYWMKLSKEKSNKQRRINSKSLLMANNWKCLVHTIHSCRRGKKRGWNADQKSIRNGKWEFKMRWQRGCPLKSILCADLSHSHLLGPSWKKELWILSKLLLERKGKYGQVLSYLAIMQEW